MYNFFYAKPQMKTQLQLLKAVLLVCNAAALLLYAFLRLLFYDFPFEVTDELGTIAKLLSVASGFSCIISLPFIIAAMLEYYKIHPVRLRFPRLKYMLPGAAVAILLVVLLSCNGNTMIAKGIKKDFGTGLTSSWSNMEPEKVMLVMNNEVLNHTDIPLGESFLLVNDNIKGLKVKEGKVSVGCSLTIRDKNGTALLDIKDLFEGRDTFDEKDAKMLKCTVSTGKPMEWEEKYDVAVTFWDKYGDGKIDNKVTIRCIDIP